MEEFLWSEDRNWSVVDISSVLSESVDWLYDRDTPGSQAATEVTLATTMLLPSLGVWALVNLSVH